MQHMARFQPDDGAILVTFPDVPEAITGGATEAEAMANAGEALELALLTYATQGRPLPRPTHRAAKDGSYRVIFVSAAAAAKMALIDAFRDSGMTRVALAARLGKGENEVRRMLDPHHRTKLPAIEGALRALGKRLVVTVEAA
jgi:antitoxin HicB